MIQATAIQLNDPGSSPTSNPRAGLEHAVLESVNPTMARALAMARGVAHAPTTVLLQGDTGAGKEIFARLIHAESGRPGDYVAVNCAVLAPTFDATELFHGNDGGTLVLDEVSELPLEHQARLLRLIHDRQDRQSHAAAPPVRLIATTHRDLAAMVEAGTFRRDLYYRLNVFPITIPSLSARPEDLPALTHALLSRLSRSFRRATPTISPAAMALLEGYDVPGNVRELENLLERAMILSGDDVIEAEALVVALPEPNPMGLERALQRVELTLAELEREAIVTSLRRHRNNRTHAAEALDISVRTLRNKLREYREAGTLPADVDLDGHLTLVGSGTTEG